MKFSVYLTFIIMVAIVFTIFSLAVQESNQEYTDSAINSSEWESKYDYSSSINSSISTLQEQFKNIANPDTGFFTKIGLGIVAIPYALIALPLIIIDSLSIGGSIVVDSLNAFGVPPKIISLIIIMIFIWGIFKLVQMWNKSEV